MSDPFNFAMPPAGNQAPQYQQQYQQPPQQQYQQPQYQQQPPQQQQPLQQQQYGQQPPQQQQQQQLVVATQPSNPYAGIVAPQQQQQQQQPAASPWDAPAPVPPPAMASTASANTFDPFASAPAPAQAPPQQQQQQQYQAAPVPPVVQDPWAAAPPQSAPAPQQQQQYQAAPATNETYQQPSSYSNGNTNYAAPSNPSYENSNRQIEPASNGGGGNNDDDDDRDYVNNKSDRNPYSQALTQTVSGSKKSGLPKAELIGKKGFVLSRISFRTIVMKKWKQSFWVQYGGHTMLWFRTQGDFDDWLNNPYHTQFQRSFLIKLAINFVHDLYKPNVRGYQVTQCRTKPYGKNKVVRQFKLERWMDYGPTIAAAFGSYDPKEVDACREAIVECMKNTPLDNGMRATGAVKEHHERQQQEEMQRHTGPSGGPNGGGAGSGGYNNYSLDPNHANGMTPTRNERSNSVPDFDLLGDNNHGVDDSASVPPGAYARASTGDLFSGALVPAVNPNAAYPGAPPAQAVGNLAPQPAFYPSAAPQPPAYGAPAGAPAPQAYQQQQQQQQPQYQQQQQQPQYPGQAPAPAFAQPPPQAEYGGYNYQQQQPQMQQQPAAGGYPAASYPVPTQQF